MNLQLRPHNLENSPYKELIHSLTTAWLQTPLPAQEMSYEECARAIRTLLLTTQSPERTNRIVEAILNQATELQKTSAWVLDELKFEGMLEGVDRIDFLRLEMEQADVVDDALLDQYNERINRFSRTD